jgi:hypothetical protein
MMPSVGCYINPMHRRDERAANYTGSAQAFNKNTYLREVAVNYVKGGLSDEIRRAIENLNCLAQALRQGARVRIQRLSDESEECSRLMAQA